MLTSCHALTQQCRMARSRVPPGPGCATNLAQGMADRSGDDDAGKPWPRPRPMAGTASRAIDSDIPKQGCAFGASALRVACTSRRNAWSIIDAYGALEGLHGSGKVIGTRFGGETEDPDDDGIDDHYAGWITRS